MPSFQISRITFTCTVIKIDDISWKATADRIFGASGDSEAERLIYATGDTEDSAVENLKGTISKEFLFSSRDLTLGDIVMSLIKWFIVPGKLMKSILRAFALLVVVAIATFLFIDLSDGSIFKIKKNIASLTDKKVGTVIQDSGFLTESFMRNCMNGATKTFWASGVSFRNLHTANRDALINLLNRHVEVKIVMLSPSSPLAEPSQIRQFSRTASIEDIRKTIMSLTATDGIFTNAANSNQEVFLADQSPFVPLIRVDDTFYVSFLFHTDQHRSTNSYNGPYIKFNLDTKYGQLLHTHFINLLTHDSTKRIFR